jgi:hypothetical protein
VLYPALLKQLGGAANSTRYKGIVYEPLPEGRHFYDPFFWQRIKAPAVMIAPDEIGILIRRYGRVLPPGKTVATGPDERGPEAPFYSLTYNLNFGLPALGKLLRNLGFMEMIGRKLYPVLGSSYVIVARKRLQRFIPIRTQWSVRRQLIATSLVKPTAFENRDHDER